MAGPLRGGGGGKGPAIREKESLVEISVIKLLKNIYMYITSDDISIYPYSILL